VLEARRRLLGEDHLQTATAKNNLALTLAASRWRRPLARRLLKDVVAVKAATLGSSHPDTRSAINNLAATTRGPESHELLAMLARTAPRGAERESLSELTIAGNHALTRLAGGDSRAARAEQEGIARKILQQVGEEHPQAIVAMSNLATTLARSGDMAGARRHLERALEASRRVLGEDHPTTSNILKDLVALHLDQRNLDGAWDVVRRSRGPGR
jgi:hypothetical protein